MIKPDGYRHQPKHVAGSMRKIKLCLDCVCVLECLGIHNAWAGVDPCVVGPEAYTIMGARLKKKNIKLRTQN